MDLKSSELAKTLLIDALFAEIVPEYPKLKIWKAATLSADNLTGIVDYLLAPNRAYMSTPLLCVAESKKDDFEQGTVQCIAEMAAFRWNNRQRNRDIDVYGIVSNAQIWQFYKLTLEGEILKTGSYTTEFLPESWSFGHDLCGLCKERALKFLPSVSRQFQILILLLSNKFITPALIHPFSTSTTRSSSQLVIAASMIS